MRFNKRNEERLMKFIGLSSFLWGMVALKRDLELFNSGDNLIFRLFKRKVGFGIAFCQQFATIIKLYNLSERKIFFFQCLTTVY